MKCSKLLYMFSFFYDTDFFRFINSVNDCTLLQEFVDSAQGLCTVNFKKNSITETCVFIRLGKINTLNFSHKFISNKWHLSIIQNHM